MAKPTFILRCLPMPEGVAHHSCRGMFTGLRGAINCFQIQGKLPVVGDTVDLSVPAWSNTIGAGQLVSTWEDPEFDPVVHAFYYVRVLEIPTPRWTAYDRIRLNVDMPAEVVLETQERAYTSPIWYSPEE